jgi:hypothetical protein
MLVRKFEHIQIDILDLTLTVIETDLNDVTYNNQTCLELKA